MLTRNTAFETAERNLNSAQINYNDTTLVLAALDTVTEVKSEWSETAALTIEEAVEVLNTLDDMGLSLQLSEYQRKELHAGSKKAIEVLKRLDIDIRVWALSAEAKHKAKLEECQTALAELKAEYFDRLAAEKHYSEWIMGLRPDPPISVLIERAEANLKAAEERFEESTITVAAFHSVKGIGSYWTETVQLPSELAELILSLDFDLDGIDLNDLRDLGKLDFPIEDYIVGYKNDREAEVRKCQKELNALKNKRSG